MSSCVPHKQILNFRAEGPIPDFQDHDVENLVRVVIQPDDILYIRVHSKNPVAAAPYNLTPESGGNNVNSEVASFTGYLVDPMGFINFPVLGEIKTGGLTTNELKEELLKLLEPHLSDAVINIRFLNFRISVLGEVNSPSTFSIQGERITILEALGRAGDFTPYSNRSEVVIIREQNGKRIFGKVDLKDPNVFRSPYFYLLQNDIIYVEPIKAKTATIRDPISEVLPIVSGIITIGALLIALRVN